MKRTSTFRQLIIFSAFAFLFSVSALGQTKYSFSGLGASSGGFEAITTSPTGANIRISDNASFFSPVLFSGVSTTSAVVFTIKGDGVNTGTFTFHDMTWRPFNGSRTLTGTTIVFKRGALADVTWNLSATYQAALSFNAEVSAKTIFGESSTVTGVTEIIITADLDGSSNSDVIEFKDITLSSIAAPVVNTAPAIGGTSAGQAVNDNSTISPFSAITVTDADGDNVTATITLDSDAKGVITGADAGSGPYTMTSRTAAAMQTAIRALVFNPTDNRAAVSETTTFTVNVDDATDNTDNNTTTVISSAVAPSVNSVAVNGSPAANATSVSFDVTFSESVTGVGTSDFSVDGSGVTGSVTGISGSGTSYVVTVTSVSGTGTLSIDLNSSGTGITDTGGTAISGGFTAGATHTVDTNAPSVNSIAVNGSPAANATSVSFDVTFSESVTGVGTSDFAVDGSGVTGSVTGISGSGASYVVTVTSVSGTGTLSIDLNSSGTGIVDGSSNAISGGFTAGATHTVDTNAPSVNSIAVNGSPAANVTSVSFDVTFSESVTGVGTSDFSVDGSGVTGSVTGISGSGASYVVTVTSVSGTGTLSIDLNSSGTGIVDGSSNAISGGFTAGATHTVDTNAPSVNSIAVNGSPAANATSVSFDVIFNESVTGVGTSDFAVDGSGVTGSVTGISGSGASYVVTVTSVSGTGTLSIDLNSSGTGIVDGSSNAISGGFTAGATHTVDTNAPNISSVSPSSSSTVNTANVGYTLSEAIASGNVTFTRTGGTDDVNSPHVVALTGSELNSGTRASAALTNDPPLVSGTIYTISFDGTDAAGNTATTVNSTSVTYDVPTVTLSQSDATFAEAAGTNTITATLSATSSEDITITIGVKSGGTATITDDFTLSTTSIVITAGNTTGTATLTAVQDVIDEENETITIEVTGVTNASENGTQEVTSSVTDDDTSAVTIADISSNENDGAITVTATLDNAVQGGFTVDVSTADGTATIADSDYSAVTSQTLTFAGTAGETQTFTVTPTGDTKLEANETVTVSQSNLAATSVSVTITDGATVTINNDDAAAVTIADISGNENDGAITVTATLDNAVQGGFTVDVSTADGTATTADSDYSAVTSQTLTFAGTAGETQTFTVTPTGDTKLEANETVTVSQSNLAATSVSVTITDGATVTINNDDAAAVTIADISGNENDGAITVTATLDNAVQGGFTVDVSTADGTATTADSDYSAVTSQTLTFAGTAGETQTFTVTPTGDTKLEANETVTVSQSNLAATSVSVTITDGATVTINNDDVAAVTIADISGNENDGAITVTATLDNEVQGGFTVDVSTADGTATTADSDYGSVTSQTLTFAGTAGETQTFTITPTGDTKLEANETVTVSQSNLAATSVSVTITDGATVTINNDDSAAVTIADVSGNEDDGAITVTATLDNAVQGGFTVDVSTADGTATTADSDYSAVTSQTLTFAGTAGETQTFTVTPTGDTKLEANETVTVSQSNLAATSVSVTITDGATVTINNDDVAAVTIADISGNENDGAITVTATLDNEVQGGFTVDVSTADGTATTADSDYGSVTSQTLTFAGTAGETQTFTITPTGDTKLEANETVTVSQSNLAATSVSVTITDGATVTINNDDAAAVTIADASGNEDDGAITVTATLDNAVQGGFTVDVSTADGTATTADSDYSAVTSQTLTFAGTAGETQTFTVTPTTDSNAEGNETITVSQSNLAATSLSVTITDGATVTINDDDAVQFSVDDPSVTEGDAGTSTLSYTVSLNNAASGTVTVDVTTSNGTATAGTDYTALSTTTLTFTPGQTSKTVDVTVSGDETLEANETINLDLTNATGLSLISDAQGVGTINNDDAAAVTIADASGNEDDGAITVTATLDNAVQGGFTVDVSTADGTATTADSDYGSVTSQTLTFAGTAGETQTFTVTPTGDTKLEANETVTVSQSNLAATSVSVTITDGATVTINNDDAAAVTIADASGNEDDGAITVTATLDNAVQGGFTVDVSTADGTATTADSDYGSVTSQTLTFAGTAGETQTFTITPTGDTKLEANETVTVSQSNLAATSVSVTITDGATVTINNDDAAAVTIADISGNENDGAITVTATLDNAVQGGFTVDVSTADGTATTADSDYGSVTSQTLTFAGTAGETQTFTVTPTGDTKLEANETVTVSQSNLAATSVSVTITDGATVTINNDDAAAVTIADASGNENDGAITVTATLDNAVQGGFTVDVSTADGTATTADSDYGSVTSQTLTFAGTAGETQTFTITPTGDTKLEANETVTVSQSNLAATSVSVTITDGATVTINNDDSAAVTIADVSGNEDDGAITVTATLDNAVQGGFTVDVSTADGTATTADSDYGSVTSQTLTFAGTAGETQTFTVTPTTDSNAEGNETIAVSQSNLAATSLSVTITDGATVTINDDDDGTAPTGYSITWDDALIGASEASTSKFTFAGAEVGATYNYTVSSTGGGTDVTGTGTIATTTDQITLADLSGLGNGTLTLSVTLTDPSSNVGTAVTDNTIIDTTAPSAPVVSSITNDTGVNGADEITSDNTPDANGTAEANSTVEVFVDGVSAGTTTADGSGNWTMTYNGASPVNDGTIQLTAKATDAAGNSSILSAALSVTIDTSAPAAPSVTSITDDTGANGSDQTTKDQTLSFNGTSEANATVEVFIGGISIGTTSADGAGQWSFDHQGTTLAEAVYGITAKATDAAGNVSPESASLPVTIDTTAPEAPSIDLDATFDSGFSDSDNLTNHTSLRFNGTAEPNAGVEVFINNVSFGVTGADVDGVWTLTTSPLTLTGEIEVKAVATDQVGNAGAASEILFVTLDTEVVAPTLSPADNATEILPNQNLILTFAEEMRKGGNSISIRRTSDDSILESFDVSSDKVTVSGSTVTINPDNAILPPASEFYVTIGLGALIDNAGNDYAGITNSTDWSFTTIAAPIITSVTAPADGSYGIGDDLDFIVTFSLPITMVSTYEIPLTVGSTLGTAVSQGATASATVTFRYTVLEGQLDTDGIVLGSALNLLSRNSSIKDEFGTDAVLTLNNVASTANILIDGVKPTPTITSTAVALVNGVFETIVEFDEPVAGFSLNDISVTNGTASNFTAISNDKKWSIDITPTTDGTVTVGVAAAVATDVVGNDNNAATNLTREFDGTAPTVTSISRKDDDQLNTATTSADFTVIFSENVSGVDAADFEIVTAGGVTAAINTVTQVDAKTYTINVNSINGEGTIGVSVKDDDTILDEAANKLGGTGLGNGDFTTSEVYTTNFAPTDIAISPGSISENNAVGAVVGALSSTDADVSDSHTYTIVSGTGDTDNASFTIDGGNLKAAESFDFETKSSYSIRVKSDDGHGASYEKALTISIDNVGEASIFVTGDISFAVSALGLSQQLPLTVTNDGEIPVEVRVVSTPAGFTALPSSLILAVGASADISIKFIPTEVRAYSGNITFDYEGGNVLHPVSGEGAIITAVDDGTIEVTDIALFPNPANQMLTIDLSKLNGRKLDIEMINGTGIRLFSRPSYTEKTLRLDVSNYESGIYIMQFTDGRSVVRKKVMIKR